MSDILILLSTALMALSVILAIASLARTEPPRGAAIAFVFGLAALFAGAWIDPPPFRVRHPAVIRHLALARSPARRYQARFDVPCGRPIGIAESRVHSDKETKMPKMKTKSAAKKRFSMTASGKVKAGPAGKRHGMIKRSTKFIRDVTGTMILSDADAKIVKKYMPYNR